MNNDRHPLARLLDPLRRRIALMVRRAVTSLVNDDNPVQTMQLKLFKCECRDGVERLQEYGFSSVPLPGCQGLATCVDGECGHEVVVATEDRRYRPVKQQPGDVMIYTDANKKDGADTEHHIHLQPAERLTSHRAKKIILDADETIELRTAGGKNFIRIGPEDYGIRFTVNGGFDNGGSDIRMKGGQIWEWAADE